MSEIPKIGFSAISSARPVNPSAAVNRVGLPREGNLGQEVKPSSGTSEQSDVLKRLTKEEADRVLSSDGVAQAVSRLEDRMRAQGTSSHIEFDSESGRFVVKITDAEYGNVVLQIPSQDSLDLQKRLEEITGMILHKTG